MSLNQTRPDHIGVCTGTGIWKGWYVITAEYNADGNYLVLASYKRLGNAQNALPKIKRKLKWRKPLW